MNDIDKLRDDVVRSAREAVRDLDGAAPYPAWPQNLRAAVAKYEAATTPKFGEWMPCSVRQPSLGMDAEDLFLATLANGSVTVVEWWRSSFREFSDQEQVFSDDVVAWMPLPPAYKPEPYK